MLGRIEKSPELFVEKKMLNDNGRQQLVQLVWTKWPALGVSMLLHFRPINGAE